LILSLKALSTSHRLTISSRSSSKTEVRLCSHRWLSKCPSSMTESECLICSPHHCGFAGRVLHAGPDTRLFSWRIAGSAVGSAMRSPFNTDAWSYTAAEEIRSSCFASGFRCLSVKFFQLRQFRLVRSSIWPQMRGHEFDLSGSLVTWRHRSRDHLSPRRHLFNFISLAECSHQNRDFMTELCQIRFRLSSPYPTGELTTFPRPPSLVPFVHIPDLGSRRLAPRAKLAPLALGCQGSLSRFPTV